MYIIEKLVEVVPFNIVELKNNTFSYLNPGGIIKTGERASYQPSISDSVIALMLQGYCQAIVRLLSLRELSPLSHAIERLAKLPHSPHQKHVR